MDFDLSTELDFYARSSFCNDLSLLGDFRTLLQEEAAFTRDNLEAHFTASAFVYDPKKDSALLVHHRKLEKFLQPGGHADGEKDLCSVAKKELWEECSVKDLELVPGIFDLDKHRIPLRPEAPEHFHYDVRFLFLADSEIVEPKANEEIFSVKWVQREELRVFKSDESVDRMFDKARRYLGSNGG